MKATRVFICILFSISILFLSSCVPPIKLNPKDKIALISVQYDMKFRKADKNGKEDLSVQLATWDMKKGLDILGIMKPAVKDYFDSFTEQLENILRKTPLTVVTTKDKEISTYLFSIHQILGKIVMPVLTYTPEPYIYTDYKAFKRLNAVDICNQLNVDAVAMIQLRVLQIAEPLPLGIGNIIPVTGLIKMNKVGLKAKFTVVNKKNEIVLDDFVMITSDQKLGLDFGAGFTFSDDDTEDYIRIRERLLRKIQEKINSVINIPVSQST